MIIASSERESQEVICNPTTPLHTDSGGYLVVITGFSRLQRVIFCHCKAGANTQRSQNLHL